MPVKNAGNYLEECLESIIGQTEKNWELLAVDDHSGDESLKLLKKYSHSDPRIRIFENKGEGIIAALRTAYNSARGEFISRMDADDKMPPDKLHSLKELLLSHGKGSIATAKVQYFSNEGLSEGYINYQNWLNSLCDKKRHWNEIYKECVIASPCWMLHREDLDNCMAFQPDSYPEDYDLVFRFYEKGLKVIASDKILHYWRDHPERTSRNHLHYAAQSFYELKLHYFLKLDYDPKRPLVLWGAGTKGKRMARLLQSKTIPFKWVSNNPKKHGKEIYDQLLHDFEQLVTEDCPQIIVTVALRNAKKEIKQFLNQLQLEESRDYWFFS